MPDAYERLDAAITNINAITRELRERRRERGRALERAARRVIAACPAGRPVAICEIPAQLINELEAALPKLEHPNTGTLRCSCGGNVLLVFQVRSDGTEWVIPRCDRCLADSTWLPISKPEGP